MEAQDFKFIRLRISLAYSRVLFQYWSSGQYVGKFMIYIHALAIYVGFITRVNQLVGRLNKRSHWM